MSLKKQRSFFDIYAHEYDLMTDAQARVNHHSKEVKALADRFKPEMVLDAGCATGLTTRLFAESGIRTIGIDRSRTMIKTAKQNYGHIPMANFQGSSFEKLPQNFNNKFDLIVCLANSISGVGSLHNLYLSFKNFHKALKPGGTLILQLLNYISIVDGELLPIKATRSGDIYYQRFSERKGKRLYIYVNRLQTDTSPLSSEMFRHEFENFTPVEVVNTLKKAHFKKISRYNDLFLEKPFGKSSRDLVISTVK